MSYSFQISTGRPEHRVCLLYENEIASEIPIPAEAVDNGAVSSSRPDDPARNERKNALPFSTPRVGAAARVGNHAMRLNAWLLSVEHGLSEDHGRLAEFVMLLSDSTLMQNQGSQHLLAIELGDMQAYSSEMMCVCAAFYKSLCLFLAGADRYVGYDAWLAYLFAAWQWYNLVKHLSAQTYIKAYEEIKHNPEKEIEEKDIEERAKKAGEKRAREWVEELAAAHRTLTTLIEDPHFAQAQRWLAVWNYATYKSGPLLREQLRLSLPLWQFRKLDERGFSDWCLDQPLPAPGCFTSAKPIWEVTALHPVFEKKAGAQTAVRQLVVGWLLPRYDIGNTLRLARLLRRNRPLERQIAAWLLIAGVLPWLLFLSLIGTWLVKSLSGIQNPAQIHWGWLLVVCTLEFIVGLTPLAAAAVFYFDLHTLAHLALPRLVGGVFIGYSALVLQGDSLKLHHILWDQDRAWFAPLLLWLLVLIVGFLYIYFDTSPMVRDHGMTLRRTILILLLSLVVSAVIGLFTVAFTTAMARECPYAPTDLRCYRLFLLGPIGWIDLRQYISFVPLALFTGLVTQFIFEERTLTASVWAPEQE